MNYPHVPGYKELNGTSQLAAETTESRVETLRSRVLELIAIRSMTADECAMELNESILSIRPRFSELRATSQIEPSGVRRRNASGHSAVVWKIAKSDFQLTST